MENNNPFDGSKINLPQIDEWLKQSKSQMEQPDLKKSQQAGVDGENKMLAGCKEKDIKIIDFGKLPSEIPATETAIKKIELSASEWDALISKHIEKMWGSLEMASVEYFMNTGKINGGFRLRLISLCLFYKWAIDDKEFTYSKSK